MQGIRVLAMAVLYHGTSLFLPVEPRLALSTISFAVEALPRQLAVFAHRPSSLACLTTIGQGHPRLRVSFTGRPFLRVVILDPGKPSTHSAVPIQRAVSKKAPRASVVRTIEVSASSRSILSADIMTTTDDQEVDASAGTTVAVRDTVELTDMEERIFATLTATLKHFGLQTQLRVAGGWVRDKLIGRNSIDIDIALDDMLGRVFCEKVNEHLRGIGEATHSIGVIQSNPDQSKHLETANMRVCGMPIDFVNLRVETYTENGRIPGMEFGSPEQDAYRRDLTINSLFYNINTGMVEDFTKQGVADLRAGIIRTPLPPDTTFLDDPLRVCRAVRFGARFNFKLDEELKKAAASEAVRTALENKVSRERIGHEIDLMLRGNQPEKAMQNLEDLGLFSAVFRVCKESEADPPIMENYGRLCVVALQAATEVLAKFRYASEITNEQRRLLIFGALFLPLHPSTYFSDKKKKKKKKIPVSGHIIRESLKLKTNDALRVEALHCAALKFRPVIEQLLQTDLDAPNDVKNSLCREDSKFGAVVKHRVELGILLVNIKEHWQGALLLASIMELLTVESQREAESVHLLSEKWIDEKVELCNTVKDVVMKLGLEKVWESKPLLDGNEIMTWLNLEKGKQVQEWKDRVLRWQLGHPYGTSEECHNWLLEENVKRLKSE